MTLPPDAPKLYHIVHWDRLKPIVASHGLLSDVELGQINSGTTIGMTDLKQRRMTLDVSCHTGLKVGECVPFYFCPRSVMLYLLHRSNHPNLRYTGGQTPITHLRFDMHTVRQWADNNGLRWCFTTSNAAAFYTEHYCDPDQLNLINWEAVGTRNWSAPDIKEAKQSEFLVEKRIPWSLVEEIGIYGQATLQQANAALPIDGHRPTIKILPEWYY